MKYLCNDTGYIICFCSTSLKASRFLRKWLSLWLPGSSQKLMNVPHVWCSLTYCLHTALWHIFDFLFFLINLPFPFFTEARKIWSCTMQSLCMPACMPQQLCSWVIFIINLAFWFFPTGWLSNKNSVFTVHVFVVKTLSWCRYWALSRNALVPFSEWIDFIVGDFFSFLILFNEKCQAGWKRGWNLLAPHQTQYKTLISGDERVLTSVQHFF